MYIAAGFNENYLGTGKGQYHYLLGTSASTSTTYDIVDQDNNADFVLQS